MGGVEGASHTHSLAGLPQYQAEGLGTRLQVRLFNTDSLWSTPPSLSSSWFRIIIL